MHHAQNSDTDAPVDFGPDVQDCWDNSLEILWQLEQEGPDSKREHEQKDLLHSIELPAASAIAQSGNVPAGPPTATSVEASGTQRRLQTRRIT